MGGQSGASKLGSSSGSYSIGGNTLSSSRLGKNGQVTKVNLDPNTQAALDAANAGVNNTTGMISGALATTPEEQAAYAQQLYAPVANTINTAYDQAGQQATDKFNAQGGLNSVGFNRYQNNTITKNRVNTLANAQDTANTESYNLASQKLQPILQALSAYQGVGNNIYNQATGFAGQSTSGQNASTAYNQAALQYTTPSYFQSLFSPQAIQGQVNSFANGAGKAAGTAAMAV